MVDTAEFVRWVQAGEFAGRVRVFVDNDSVTAIIDQGEYFEDVCDFNGEGPEGALILVLEALGVEAERA